MAIRKIISRSITDGAVVATDVAALSIDSTKLASNAVTNAKIASNAISSDKLDTNIQFGFKNRIINGAMVISQRGTSFAGLTNGSNGYTLDRWYWNESGTSTAVQTVAQSTSAPSNGGFSQSLQVTTTTAQSSLGSNNTYRVGQSIEGFNVADLMWGTASAKTVTLSFWVRSSLTGTFGGVVFNNGLERCYVYSYTINAADTWEYKTVTIAGDTTGTWLTNNGLGLAVEFSMGAGSDYLTTPGSWGSTRVHAPTGQVNVAGTSGATFYITGVQLEVGSSATGFEYVNYQTSLANCQRYYYKTIAGSSYGQVGTAFLGSGGTGGSAIFPLPVPMRVLATSVDWSGLATCQYASAPAIAWTAATLNGQQTLNLGQTGFTLGSSGGGTGLSVQIIANNNANAYIGFSAEL